MSESLMHVALCCDDLFVMPTSICLVSFFENNRGSNVFVHIVSFELSQENERLLYKVGALYSQKLFIHYVGKKQFEGLHIEGRYGPEMFLRFCLPDLIDCDKALYLDGDTIINCSLTGLFQTDISHFACAAVEDENGDDVHKQNRLSYRGDYFNSGVILMNLDYWRKNNVKLQLINYILSNPSHCELPDQDALNCVLHGKVLFLDYKYNFQFLWFDDSKPCYLKAEKMKKVYSAREEAAIIHYCYGIKPWHKEYDFPYKNVFLRYAYLHDSLHFKPRSIHSTLYNLLSILVDFFISLRYRLTGNK